MTTLEPDEDSSRVEIEQRAMTGRIGGLLRRSGGVARDGAWSLSHQAVALATSLLSFALLTSQLGPADYGAYAGLYGMIVLLSSATFSWVMLIVFQRIIREHDDLGVLVRSCTTIMALGISAALALLAVVGPLLFDRIDRPTILAIAAADLILGPMVMLAATVAQATVGVPLSIRFHFLHTGLRIAIILALALTTEITLTKLGYVMFVVYLPAAAAVWLYFRHRFGVAIRPGRVHRKHLSQGMLYAGTLVGFSVQDDGDTPMLNAFRHERDAGLYAAAYRIVQMGLMPINSLLGSSHQRFLSSDETRRNEHVDRALRFTSVAVAYGLAVTLVTWLAADLVLSVFPSEFEETATVMRTLVPLVVLRGASHFAFNGLLGLGRYTARLKILATSSGTVLVLYFLLIPAYSWKGAVAASLIGESLFVVLTWIVLVRAQREHDDWLNREPDLVSG